jgi:hypothetical protein
MIRDGDLESTNLRVRRGLEISIAVNVAAATSFATAVGGKIVYPSPVYDRCLDGFRGVDLQDCIQRHPNLAKRMIDNQAQPMVLAGRAARAFHRRWLSGASATSLKEPGSQRRLKREEVLTDRRLGKAERAGGSCEASILAKKLRRCLKRGIKRIW